MASRIYLADLRGKQSQADDIAFNYGVQFEGVSRAIISKGNIIDGIEARA